MLVHVPQERIKGWPNSQKHLSSLAGLIRTKTSTLPLLSMTATRCWERRALPQRGKATSCSYGAGLQRYLQTAGVEVLEVTAPDKLDRRRRGKNDDFDAQSAAHAAFAERRTVTPRSRDGMVESLRVLKVCRKTAVQARRVALQIIQTTIVCAPDRLRDLLRKMTRMQLIRTLAAWRPDLTRYRDVEEAYRITLKSLARRYLELHDEIADLDDMIEAIVKDLAPELLDQTAIGLNSAAQLLLTALPFAALAQSLHLLAKQFGTG